MPRPSKKPHEVWERQKERIRTVYITEENTLRELMDIMRTKYDFDATKHEYTKRLGMWQMGKYAKTKRHTLALRAKPAPRAARILVRSSTDLARSGDSTDQEILRHNNSLHTVLQSVPQFETLDQTLRATQLGINVTVENIPWFQFQEHLKRIIPKMMEQFYLSWEWTLSPRSMLGSLSTGDSSMKHARSLLRHILGRRLCESTQWDLDLQKLGTLLPQRSGLDDQCSSNEPFLMLIQACIYLSSNNLLRRQEMDGFVDYMINYGFVRLLNEAINELNKTGLPTLQIFLSKLLLSAARLKNTSLVSALLEKGVDPNHNIHHTQVDPKSYSGRWIINRPDEMSALQISVFRADLQTTLVLLKHNACANGKTKGAPFAPLELAITTHMESRHLAEALISAGANVDQLCHLGGIPVTYMDDCNITNRNIITYELGHLLTKASAMQNIECLRLLIDYQKKKGSKSLHLGPALNMAIRNNDMQIIHVLIQHGADISPGRGALGRSATQYIRRDFKTYRRHSRVYFRDLQTKESYGSEEFANRRKWVPAGIPWQIMTPIQLAARQNNTDLARILLLHGKVNAKAQLSWDIISRSFEKVKSLFPEDIDQRCFTYYQSQVLRWSDLLKSSLHESVENGNLQITEMLLKAGAVVDCVNTVGTTVLQLACGLSKLPVDKTEKATILTVPQIRMHLVKMLLNWDANIRMAAGTWNGRTALQAAAEQGDKELVQLLIQKGADVNAAPSPVNGKTALQAAVVHGDMGLVQLLIDNGADVDAAPSPVNGKKALAAAIEARMPCIVDVLLRAGSVQTIEHHCFRLQNAASQGDFECVEKVLAQVASLNMSDQPTWVQATEVSLKAAIESGQVDVVRSLLDGGLDVNNVWDGETALCTAVRFDNLDIFNLLLSYGGDLDAPDLEITPLAIASASRFASMIHAILQVGVDVNRVSKQPRNLNLIHSHDSKSAYTALQWIVKMHSLEFPSPVFGRRQENMITIKLLLSNGADANGSEQCTPLFYACINGDMPLMNLLIEHGGDLETCIARHTDIVARVACMGNVEVLRIILDRGADLGGNAVLSAVRGRKRGVKAEAIIQMLLDAGADVNDTDEDGETAIATAADRGYISIVQLLLDHHADVNFDLDTLQQAVSGGHFNICSLLIQRGANVNSKGCYMGTALDQAAKSGYLDIASLLLENDKQLDTIEERCSQAAVKAAANGHWGMAQYLRKYTRQKYGYTNYVVEEV